MQDLVKILKLVEVEDPRLFLLPLLDLICKGVSVFWCNRVHIICPCPSEYHFVSIEALLLLEEVEGAFGTAVQSIKTITTLRNLEEPVLSAISSRMSHQQAETENIKCFEVIIKDRGSVEAFITLLQAQKVGFSNLTVSGAIGEEGWKRLAGALKGKVNVELWWVLISRQDSKEVRMEDMRDIWEFRGGEKGIGVVNTKNDRRLFVAKSEYDWEQAWARLQQISEMTERMFIAEWKNGLPQTTDTDEEESRDGLDGDDQGDDGGE